MNAVGQRLFSCKLCHQPWFPDKHAWTTHMLTCHKADVHAICEECCKIFKSHTGFSDHKKIYHASEKEKFKCTICRKLFISEYKLRVHEISHSNDKPFKCIECNKCYKYKKDLHNHNLVKHSDRETFGQMN